MNDESAFDLGGVVMALRLNQVVLSGEINNTEHYSTRGYLELRGDETGLHLELTGNCGTTLAGRRFQFTARPIPEEPIDPNDGTIRDASKIDWLAHQQVGPTGTMELGEVKTFECSGEEYYRRCKLGEPPPMVMKPYLYLEWYSQNGRFVLELVDPEIEFLEDRPLVVPAPGAHLITNPTATTEIASPTVESEPQEVDPDDMPPTGLGVSIVRLDEDDRPTVDEQFYSTSDLAEEEDDDDESFLPPNDELQQALDQQAADVDWAIAWDGENDDSEHMRELKLMDELLERRTGSYLIDLIDGPLQLPKSHDVPEADAEGPLKAVLGQLALYGIQIHVC